MDLVGVKVVNIVGDWSRLLEAGLDPSLSDFLDIDQGRNTPPPGFFVKIRINRYF